MRRIKYFLGLVIAVVLVTFFYQNWEFFIDLRDLRIDFYFFNYTSPELPTGIYFLAVFVLGALISYFTSLSERFKNRKIIRRLEDQLTAGEQKINEMQTRLESRTAVVSAEPAPADAGE